MPTTHPEMTLRMSPVIAEYFRAILDNTGPLVVGHRLFDRAPVELQGPLSVIQGIDVTHLRCRVRYP